MKIRVLSVFSLVMSALLSGSCLMDEIPVVENTIHAVMENDQTKTSVTDEGSFTWSSGDQVWLHTTAGSVVGTLSSGAGTSSANFSYGAFFGDMTGKSVYPYNSGHAVSGNELSVVLPASYDLGSNLSNTNAAMYGVNVGGTIRFNHLAGVMRFVFKNVPAGTDRFQITLDKKINGTFTADLTAAFPVLETAAATSSAEKTITLNFDALTMTSDISLYVPLPTGTYTSLSLDLYAGSKSVWTYSNTVTNTIGRKTLKLMPAVSMGGSIGGEIEGGNSAGDQEPQEGAYVDEYGINHGQGVQIDNTVWAPVNCGYHATDYPFGKLYQWGRKYGQGYVGNIYDDDWEVIGIHEDASTPVISSGGISIIEGNSINNANVFFTTSEDLRYSWSSDTNVNLWNSGTEGNPVKTEYDPCPTGWRVPTLSEFNNLKRNHSGWRINTVTPGYNGYYFSGSQPYTSEVPQIFLPTAGSLTYIKGIASGRGDGGNYWSSTMDYDYSRFLEFDSTYTIKTNASVGHACGYSVRCVKE